MARASRAVTAIRGPMLTYTGDPFQQGLESTMVYESDAIVAMADGKVLHAGPASRVRRRLSPGTRITDHGRDSLILAGFIDSHVHFPQTQIIGAYGKQLIDWLHKYAFVAEQQFGSKAHAREVAGAYLDEILRNGITTAASFCTVHPASVDALFEAAEKRGLRLIAGKVMMNRNAPQPLLDTTTSGYDDSRALIAKWHGRGRLMYAITPRFAPTSTPDQLEAAGALKKEFPDCFLQSHVSENRRECAWVQELFPDAKNYLDVYDRFGCLGRRSILGHGIWLSEDELQRCHDTGTAIAHLPTSNFFLGSGYLNLGNTSKRSRPVRVGLGTDIGGGTTFSILGTLNEAYKAAQLNGYALSAGHAFYLATRGSAHALYLEDTIGSIAPGMEADLVVLDMKSTPLIEYRMSFAEDLNEALFIQMTMGDDRAVRATYVAGRRVYSRKHR